MLEHLSNYILAIMCCHGQRNLSWGLQNQ